MNFNSHFIIFIRKLFYPLSFLYGLILYTRYWLYKKKYLHSTTFAIPTITVGNLSVGGTGKTPMVLFLLKHLTPNLKIATISRGYKRNTTGYHLANQYSNATTLGDEPFLFYKKFPIVNVAVCEDRLLGYTTLLAQKPTTQLIIFDDALQHRTIEAHSNICLTTYNQLYINDYYLPAGDRKSVV